jgi:hypothetical protein
MNGESADRFRDIFQGTRLVADAPWSAVIAAPPCALTEHHSVDGQGYPMATVWGFPTGDGTTLRTMLSRRFEAAEVPVKAALLRSIAAGSCGLPRHAIEIAHRAVGNARRARAAALNAGHVKDAIALKGESLARGLDIDDFRILATVAQRHVLPREASGLFADGRILAARPDRGQRRPTYDVHPVLVGDVAALAATEPESQGSA